MKIKALFEAVHRRKAWVLAGLGPAKAANMALAAVEFATGRERLRALPSIVKIDISPLCNLHCISCVHAYPHGSPALQRQEWGQHQKMSVGQFQRIIDQIAGRTIAVSLYYLGEPLIHPDLDHLSQIARKAGLQVHVSTNFSFALTEERLRGLIDSGITHLTVCVDGLSQDKYKLTRVGGSVVQVLNNLANLCTVRAKMGRKTPFIEVQYIKYQHNMDEVEAAQKLCKELGADAFSSLWGQLYNYVQLDPQNFKVLGPIPKGIIPHCWWPYFSMVIKYNGDVIPCCWFRHGAQYTPGADARTLGNVFETDLLNVWNSTGYRRARRLVSDPARPDPDVHSSFCHLCPVIFRTTCWDKLRYAEWGRFEDFFALDRTGIPVPINTTCSGSSLAQTHTLNTP
jgi:MoaA/NifB/PqqE/SkfB family radical SAM enzyme